MKYTVVGAGAMGLRYGIHLQYLAGLDVDFVEPTQASLDRIHQQGNKVYVERDGKERHMVAIRAFSPEEYEGDPDVWIFFLKQMQMTDTLKRLAPKFKSHQTALCAMNGMGHVEKLQQYFDDEHIIGGTAMMASVLNDFGDVNLVGKLGVEVSHYANLTNKDSDTLFAVEKDFKAATLGPVLTHNCYGTMLTKVVFNSVVNSLCTMFSVKMGQMIASEGFLEKVAKPLAEEAFAACEAAGYKLDGTVDDTLESYQYVSAVANPGHYPSMFQDMSKGRPTEVDYINGWLADTGEKNGVPCPNQRLVQNLVHFSENMRQYAEPNRLVQEEIKKNKAAALKAVKAATTAA